MEVNSTSLVTMILFGFFLGLRHAVEADHVITVSTIVSKTKSLRKALSMGISWGLGHTLILFIIGLLILIFNVNIPEKFSLIFELVVGGVLIIMGANIFYKMFYKKEHLHIHKHGEKVHMHKHSHKKTNKHSHNHKSFLIGLVHGLAGSAAIVLLILASMTDTSNGLLFILIFGMGSVLGMVLVSLFLAMPLKFASKIENMEKIIQIIAGGLSLIFGAVIITTILKLL